MSDDLDERVAPPMDVLSKSRLARLKDMGAGTLVGEMAARITELEAENTTLLDLHSKAMKSLTSQVLKRRELEAANDKMRKCLESIAEHHDKCLKSTAWKVSGEDDYHTERRDFAREAMK